MNTKKAIEFLDNYAIDQDRNKEVIELLRRGEAYKQMWEELYEISSEFNFFPLMDRIKQKHFPKEADHDYPEGGE